MELCQPYRYVLIIGGCSYDRGSMQLCFLDANRRTKLTDWPTVYPAGKQNVQPGFDGYICACQLGRPRANTCLPGGRLKHPHVSFLMPWAGSCAHAQTLRAGPGV